MYKQQLEDRFNELIARGLSCIKRIDAESNRVHRETIWPLTKPVRTRPETRLMK